MNKQDRLLITYVLCVVCFIAGIGVGTAGHSNNGFYIDSNKACHVPATYKPITLTDKHGFKYLKSDLCSPQIVIYDK